MLGDLRDASGRPRGLLRALAVVLALLLALPLTAFAVSLLRDLADAVW